MTEIVTDEELEAARGYEALFVPAVFRAWAGHVLDGADVGVGDAVLDVACGTGVVARQARARVGPGGRAVGVDPAPGMLAVARDVEPGVEWLPGTAEALPVEEAAFDGVLCQFGMMFFKDRGQAAREMARVLTRGGRVSVAVWNAIEENPAYAGVTALLDEHVGPEAGDALRMPFCMGAAEEVMDLLRDGGFTDIEVTTREEPAQFPSAATVVEAELRGWLPLFGIHLSEAEIADVTDRAEAALERFAMPSGEAVFPTSAHVVTGRKA
ncbi:methyltransferase domain-containing protein [Psychromarinibacter sp. C21-152]|uniref:Methyltransferase domain-containing protein n=1 Tax=Psychromarinibacter sediminicola TaxID=3033385 RepID=A0AAE3TAF8_9RHOB|nr:methyltransferase domain-containing protein [Psychromarinibacter sediminicola]MDF0602813.1 methyltransferase domain-containing protein [Psychromarinibacter sediminicola]